jgi:hypothetical protein
MRRRLASTMLGRDVDQRGRRRRTEMAAERSESSMERQGDEGCETGW